MQNDNAFPEQGVSSNEIFARLDRMTADDLKNDGRAFAFAYDAGHEIKEIARRAYAACMGGNGLDPGREPLLEQVGRMRCQVFAGAPGDLQRIRGCVVGLASGAKCTA